MTHCFAKLATCIALLSLTHCQPRNPYVAPTRTTPALSLVDPIDQALTRPDPIAISQPIPGFTKGINLGNCYDAPSEGAWGTVISEAHFQMAADAGMDHVRLPVRFGAPDRTDSVSPYQIREEFFVKVDWAIDQALSRGLSIMVNVHHYDEMSQDPHAHKARLYSMWEQIAARYAARPPSVAFEILNEPNGALVSSILNEIHAEALRIIRKTNPTRLVFVDPYFWAAADRLSELEVPAADPNVIGQFHMYQPILFTHQGASWMDPWYQTAGVVFPAPPSKPLVPVTAAHNESWVRDWFNGYNTLPEATNPGGPSTVFTHFDHAARWVQKTGKRVYLGEFGAIDGADPQSRYNYVWLVRTEAERRGIGWAYWDDGGRFKAMDTRQGVWNESLRQALMQPVR